MIVTVPSLNLRYESRLYKDEEKICTAACFQSFANIFLPMRLLPKGLLNDFFWAANHNGLSLRGVQPIAPITG